MKICLILFLLLFFALLIGWCITGIGSKADSKMTIIFNNYIKNKGNKNESSVQ